MSVFRCPIRRLGVLGPLVAVALAVGLAPMVARAQSAAITFTVNVTSDQADINLADDRCDASAEAGLQCTLRAAIQEVNDENRFGQPDVIEFDIPGDGVQTIRPNRALPVVVSGVVIDGYSQPGSRFNTAPVGTNAVLRIELDGSNAGAGADGLRISGARSVIRGLVINRFAGAGVFIGSSPFELDFRLLGCFIGTDATGTIGRGNRASGIVVDTDFVRIGADVRNARNLISGNGSHGVSILEGSARTEVTGNLIGTTKTGSAPLANRGNGVSVNSSREVSIGDFSGQDAPAASNTIAFNGGAGVRIVGNESRFNPIYANSIFANGGLGIDLDRLGVTPNDAADPDPGPNFLQNFPVIEAATPTVIRGTLNSNPNERFILRFFANTTGNEGETFLGQTTVVTDAAGNASFRFTPEQRLERGQTVTATATDTGGGLGNTSELSAPRGVA